MAVVDPPEEMYSGCQWLIQRIFSKVKPIKTNLRSTIWDCLNGLPMQPIQHVPGEWRYHDIVDYSIAIKNQEKKGRCVLSQTYNSCQHVSCCCFWLWVSRWLETVYLCSVIMQLTITGSDKVNLLLIFYALDPGQDTMDMKFVLFMPQCAFIALLIGSVGSIPSHSAAKGQLWKSTKKQNSTQFGHIWRVCKRMHIMLLLILSFHIFNYTGKCEVYFHNFYLRNIDFFVILFQSKALVLFFPFLGHSIDGNNHWTFETCFYYAIQRIKVSCHVQIYGCFRRMESYKEEKKNEWCNSQYHGITGVLFENVLWYLNTGHFSRHTGVTVTVPACPKYDMTGTEKWKKHFAGGFYFINVIPCTYD